MGQITIAGLAVCLSVALSACDPGPVVEPPAKATFRPATVEYRGDVVGFEAKSSIAGVLQPDARQALLVLANAEVFTAAEIWFSGRLSPHADAFRVLLRQREARTAFQELATADRLEVKLYGLSGLYFVDNAAFQAQAADLRSQSGEAQVLVGDVGGSQSVASIVGSGDSARELWNGSWPKDLAGTVRPVA